MIAPTENALLLQTLQSLVERLAAPDLTATEAREIRPRVMHLLGTLKSPADLAPACPEAGRVACF